MKYLGWLVLVGVFIGAHAAYAECDMGSSDTEVKGCLAQELRDSDKRINAVYKSIMDSKDDASKTVLRDQQRAWIKTRDKVCHLDERESDREKWLAAILSDQVKTVCVVRYTFQRVSELNDLLGKTDKAPAAQLPPAPQAPRIVIMLPTGAQIKIHDDLIFIDDGYQVVSATSREKGKWYFEIRIEPGSIAKLGDVLLVPGIRGSDGHGGVAKTLNIRRKFVNAAPFVFGLAADLDSGGIYMRVNGVWQSVPGSSTTLEVKLNRGYRMSMEGSSSVEELINQGLIKINLGDKPFEYSLPDGYRPFSEH